MKKRHSKEFSAIVLAAGRGERMKSTLPKVLADLRGRPLMYHVLRELSGLRKYVKQVIVVAGYQGSLVEEEVRKTMPSAQVVFQRRQLGTAHAVLCAKAKVKYDNVLILCADTPLITRGTLSGFLSSYIKEKSFFSLITAYAREENDLGRIFRDSLGNPAAIKEKVALSKGEDSKEINSGIYAADTALFFNALNKIKKNPRKKEFFLTDAVNIIYSRGYKIGSYSADITEVSGINTPLELCAGDRIMRLRIAERLIGQGVKIIEPDSVFIDEGVKIGPGTVIFPFTFIERDVIIGNNCSIGPFTRVRSGCRIADNACLGNFLEVNRCNISRNTKVKHFGYLGDAVIREGVNIGAGTVIANYDGRNKNKTFIEERAFIGSDTVLVAPVKVGKLAATGAGSVVTRDVKPGTIVAGVPARFLKNKRIT